MQKSRRMEGAMTQNNIKPWERMPGETSKQFEAFSIFRDIGPSRSISEVANLWSESGATSRLREWARKNKWHQRVIDYDEHMDRIIVVSHEEEIKKMVVRHAREAKLFQSKVHERLEKIDPDELKPHELIKWYETAVRIERLSLGVPTESIKQEQEFKEAKADVVTMEKLKDPKVRRRAAEFIRAIADSQSSPDRISTGSE